MENDMKTLIIGLCAMMTMGAFADDGYNDASIEQKLNYVDRYMRASENAEKTAGSYGSAFVRHAGDTEARIRDDDGMSRNIRRATRDSVRAYKMIEKILDECNAKMTVDNVDYYRGIFVRLNDYVMKSPHFRIVQKYIGCALKIARLNRHNIPDNVRDALERLSNRDTVRDVRELNDADVNGVVTFGVRDKNNEFEALNGLIQIMPQLYGLMVTRTDTGVLKVKVRN